MHQCVALARWVLGRTGLPRVTRVLEFEPAVSTVWVRAGVVREVRVAHRWCAQ
jgi:hypothetical protein